MGSVRSFTALDWVEVPGRGEMAMIAALPEGDDLYNPDLLKGQRVQIDGTEHLVLGVDTFAVPRGPGDPYRRKFGLLVEERPVSTDQQIIAWLRGVIGNGQYYAQALINDKEVADKWEESSSGVLQTGSPEAQDQWAGCWPCGNSTLSRHIVLHDPVSSLADCEAKLETVRLCERVISDDAGREYWSDGWSGLAVARMTLRYMAYGYRNAAGYRKEWQQ